LANSNDITAPILSSSVDLSGKVLARNTIYNLIGLGLPVIVAVAATPLLIRELGTERFGILSLAWVVIGYASLFDLGLGRALTQSVAERLGAGQNSEIPAVIRMSLVFISALGAVGMLVVLILTPWLVNTALRIPMSLQVETRYSFCLLALSIPFVVNTAALRGILEAYQRFGVVNALRIPMGLFTYLGPLLALTFSDSLIAVMVALLIGRIIAWAIHLLLCRQYIRAASHNSSPAWVELRHLLGLGGWMTISNIVGPIMTSLDRFLIGALVSVTAVAYYATPYQAVTQLVIVPAALVGVLFPAFAASSAQDYRRTSVLYDRAIKCVLIALWFLSMVIMTLASEGLRAWVGTEFAQNSTSVLRILTVGVLANGLALVPFALIQGVGRPDLTAKLHLIELPAYLIALWGLTRTYGIDGTAMAYTLRIAVDTILLFVLASRFLSDGAIIARRTAKGVTLVLLVLALGCSLTNTTARMVFLVLAVPASGIVIWYSILASTERKAVLNTMRSVTSSK
jgi:O-antigen/teichoic acid export membrane protein